jgi:16S rRNA (guanine527-N7)-methyltransferase
MAVDLLKKIQQGCSDLGLTLTLEQQQQLVAYVELLVKWNKVYNLTSVRDASEMVSRHILDSLAIVPYLDDDSLLDVGSGAGLPGIPVAIAKPELAVTLLDTNSKKTRFLVQAKAELSLANVTVVHARVEEAKLPLFSMITARAFSTIDDIIKLTGSHCALSGKLLLMKGVFPEDELKGITDDFELLDVISMQVPNSDAERHLVRLLKLKA